MKNNDTLRSLEPHSTTLSLIHAVKISKREMAKLSFYKGEDMFERSMEAEPDTQTLEELKYINAQNVTKNKRSK